MGLEDGRFRGFDLSGAAQAGQGDCLREAILASAAVPAIFPPRNIDGQLYADGGLRSHVFLTDFETGAARVRAMGASLTPTLTIVVNGDLRLLGRSVEYRTLDVASRAFEITLDEGLRESVQSLLRLSRDHGWRVRAVTARGADLSECGDFESPFDACVTRRLYDYGAALAQSAPIPFLSAEELAALVGES